MNLLFTKILNESNNGVTFFNEQQKLTYYNPLIETIWDIPSNTLDIGITLVEFFEILRERQIYPPQGNFQEFCNTLVSYFYTLEKPIINNLILSTGKNYEENIIPHNNGLIFIWADTTKLWETIYSLNNYKSLYSRIINNLPLPVIIVGSNGLIEDYNLLFCNFFKINNKFFNKEIHITKLFKELEPLHNNTNTTAYLSGLLLSRKDFNYNLNLLNGLNIEVCGFPLPNGNNFVIFRSANLISPKLDFQEIKNNLKDLQTSLILDLERLLNTPINTIIGFSDMLKEGYLGALNNKQQEYINKIIILAENIKNDLNYKSELTLYQDIHELSLANIDINEIIVNCMQQIKPKLQEKNIKINLNINNNINYIYTNQIALTKLITLTILYLIEQNINNSEIEIIIKNNPLEIILKDTCSDTIFSPLELNQRFDLILILKNLELLKGNYKILTQNRSFRTLLFTFNS